MASTFKNAGLDVGVLDTSAGDIYTATGSGVTAVIHAVYISNLSSTNAAKVNIKVTIDGGEGDDKITVSGGLDVSITTGGGSDVISLTAKQYRTLLEGARTISNDDRIDEVVDAKPIYITDFTVGESGDVLDYGDLLRNGTLDYDGSNPFSTGFLSLDQSGNDTLIRFDADGSASDEKSAVLVAVLKNVSKNSLVANNFLPLSSQNSLKETPRI